MLQFPPTSLRTSWRRINPVRSSYIALLKQAKYFREARDVLQEAVIHDQRTRPKADLIRADVEVDGVDRAVSGHGNLPRPSRTTTSTT
jgi:hypothetical protein